MRADLFLKKTRLIKRRTQSKLAIDKGLVYKNDILIKPGYKLKINDILTIKYTFKTITIKVTNIDLKNPEYELIKEE